MNKELFYGGSFETKKEAQERHVPLHRAGGQRHAPLRDEPSPARHRVRRLTRLEREGQDATFTLPVVTKDALATKHGEYDIVLANPPFGKKSSVTIVNEAGETSKESLIINRDDLPPPRLCELAALL